MQALHYLLTPGDKDGLDSHVNLKLPRTIMDFVSRVSIDEKTSPRTVLPRMDAPGCPFKHGTVTVTPYPGGFNCLIA
jgi:hypothetical protein